jgi:serine/threonine-protein kinase
MQLAKGQSLRALVRPETGWAMACEIGAQIADALAAAHAVGIVHRDLKPENVMVEARDGIVHCRVLDFGIARALDPQTPASEAPQRPLTRVGTVLGTPGYMPPEQALGEVVDARADLYALGVIVWELAAGRLLFDQDDPRGIALAQLTEPVPPLPGDDVPPALVELLDALLEPKREARPSSASEVRERLREIRALAGRASSVARVSAVGASPSLPTPVTTADAPPSRTVTPAFTHAGVGPTGAASGAAPPRATPRWVVPVAIAAVLAVALVAVGAALLSDAELSDVPRAARADVDTMLHDPSMLARFEAAGRLVPTRDALPPFAGHVADFELAQTCEERRDAVRALERDADARALPVLARAIALPPTGCGPQLTSDCHACMREAVAHALRSLSGVHDDAAAPPASTEPEGEPHEDPHPTKARPTHHGRGHGH